MCLMDFNQLKEKAHSLPLAPGVYIMKDQSDTVIYIGKAKKLKNRVSQYFQDTASHTPKTRLMVSKIDHFDVIIARSEFEALVLECSLIKQYQPKYNILLKDDKGYPYIRINMADPYPTMALVGKISDDKAEYFGPFGSRGVTQDLLETIQQILKLPSCAKKFPKDSGKGRVCLHYHMNQCLGWCQKQNFQAEYIQRISIARQLLLGNYKQVAQDIEFEMLQAADALNFELAASLRDRLQAIENLGKKQLVIAGKYADMDAIGYAQTESKACFSVLHFSGGTLIDKEYEILDTSEDVSLAVSTLVKQYYLARGFTPKLILLPYKMEDCELFSQLLLERFKKKTRFRVPQRGENLQFVTLANANALEEANRISSQSERNSKTLEILGKMLGIPTPARIESFDISNISGTDNVASMVVFHNGKPCRREYRRFKVERFNQQDDYGSMAQILMRRFTHFLASDKGFEGKPDLLLIDGGVTHAKVAVSVLTELGLHFPVLGMVKDDRHRTRALVTPEGHEIAIDGKQAIFALIGNIQEETHRFAIQYHKKLRSKRLQYSELDQIPGVGPKRKQLLLKTFHSLSAIGNATLEELERILPRDVAIAVYHHFIEKEGRSSTCE